MQVDGRDRTTSNMDLLWQLLYMYLRKKRRESQQLYEKYNPICFHIKMAELLDLTVGQITNVKAHTANTYAVEVYIELFIHSSGLHRAIPTQLECK